MTDQALATYAVSPNKIRAKQYYEESGVLKYRGVFDIDRDRIINSAAFRRLQYKTQVFVNDQGDHYRTRLTHTLEMVQIARWIAKALKVNEDLAETISLAHDLGHPPFGHAGEDALNQKMINFSGFSHNAHTLKLITKIEKRFIGFNGLNLSYETLEGLVKHNGAIRDVAKISRYIYDFNCDFDLNLHLNPSLEAQISAISDDIAYNNHDLEDGLRAKLFNIEDLMAIPLVGDIYYEIIKNNPDIRQELLVSEAKKYLTFAMVDDVINQTYFNLQKNHIQTLEDINLMERFMVEFSPAMQEVYLALKNFLTTKMYRHFEVNKMTQNAHNIVNYLFDDLMANPQKLPPEYFRLWQDNPSQENCAEIVCDYIAGMTDRYALKNFNNVKTF